MAQLDLEGKKSKLQKAYVFHDESLVSSGSSKWFLTGLLWVFEDKTDKLYHDLTSERKKEDNYKGKIHFKDFCNSFNAQYSQKERVAKGWFNLWLNKWSKNSHFNVLAVDKKHSKFDGKRFKEGFHFYNRFTALALKSGLSWFFKTCPELSLSIYSDKKPRRTQATSGGIREPDNFEDYLDLRLTVDTWKIKGSTYKGPDVTLDEPAVTCLGCPKEGPYSKEKEILQLTDLLLGSVQVAICSATKNNVKRWFGKKIGEAMQDIRDKPWEQQLGLHRKFSVSYFPDLRGRVYNDGPIRIMMGKNTGNKIDKKQKSLRL